MRKPGLIGGGSGRTYRSKTDTQGHYIIDKVPPGKYTVAVRMFYTNNYIYPRSSVAHSNKFDVESGKSLAVRTVSLWKMDLQSVSRRRQLRSSII